MSTVGDVIERATTAVDSLARRGETIDDEWQYVNDLETVWTARLREVADARRAETADEALIVAVELVVAEAERIADPHRAIDWLSTFPQIVLLALREPA
jgi:hypothetical protein